MNRYHGAAENFLLQGIQDWGQSDAKRAKVTAEYLKAAGFNVEPSGFPVFGRMFPHLQIKGEHGASAQAWLTYVLENLPRGRFQNELRFLSDCIKGRLADLEASNV